MQVIRSSEGNVVERTGEPIFEGQVWLRSLTSRDTGSELISGFVQFAAGARTKMHTHTGEQILYVVSGIGQVGTRQATQVIAEGDVAVIPPGEPHWHGAGDTGSPMTHFMFQRADSTTEVLE